MIWDLSSQVSDSLPQPPPRRTLSTAKCPNISDIFSPLHSSPVDISHNVYLFPQQKGIVSWQIPCSKGKKRRKLGAGESWSSVTAKAMINYPKKFRRPLLHFTWAKKEQGKAGLATQQGKMDRLRPPLPSQSDRERGLGKRTYIIHFCKIEKFTPALLAPLIIKKLFPPC